MSFLDTLKNLGLWQPQQAEQPNPYGLDPAIMKQARMSALGNIGGQLLAMSQQMTPDQRARMMSNADWSGGYQGNLMNAAQMQIIGQAQQDKTLERERMARARSMIADRIKQAPLGPARDAAMYFFEAGDLAKAGEILFKRERRFNPATFSYETVDAFGQPVGGGQPMPSAAPSPGGAAMPVQTAPIGTAPIPAPASTGVMPEAPVDQVTLAVRQATGDPSVTPGEARQIASAAAAENDPAAGLKVYRELQQQKTSVLNQDRGSAEKLKTDFEAATKEQRKVVEAAQIAENIAMDPNRNPADKLTVLYRYITTLDPAGSVREGDTQLAQQIQSLQQQMAAIYDTAVNGGPISNDAMIDIVRAMGRLGTTARGNIERKRLEARGLATSRNVPVDMVFGPEQRGARGQYPEAPIGYRVRSRTPAPGDAPVTGLTPEEEDVVRQNVGGL